MVMRDLTKRDNQYMQMWFMQVSENASLIHNKVGKVKVLPPLPVRKSSLKEFSLIQTDFLEQKDSK